MSKERVLQAVVEHLAADVAQLEQELVVYRGMAQVALAQNAELVKHNVALRQQIADRRDEIRRYVEAQMVSA
jgi:cell division protein FtsB